MIEHIALVEADFQREYRLDLFPALLTLSWRRFLTLLAGLSDASLVARLQDDTGEGGGETSLTTRAAQQAFLHSISG